MSYVDGFVLAVEKSRIDEYKAFSLKWSGFWMDNGATSYVECVGDDTPVGEVTSFPRAVQAKDDEVVVMSWITYPSKEIRDAVNRKMMEEAPDAPSDMPFDGKRMFFGGFTPLIELGKGA